MDSDYLRNCIAGLRRDLAYFTECQLATLEGMPTRTSKYQQARQQKIAAGMLEACKRYGVTVEDCHRRAPRTADWLKEQQQ